MFVPRASLLVLLVATGAVPSRPPGVSQGPGRLNPATPWPGIGSQRARGRSTALSGTIGKWDRAPPFAAQHSWRSGSLAAISERTLGPGQGSDSEMLSHFCGGDSGHADEVEITRCHSARCFPNRPGGNGEEPWSHADAADTDVHQ